MSNISIYLEPTKQKVGIDVNDETVTVGQVVQGMVTHLRSASDQGFDIDHYLRDRIGDGYAAEWQLFREDENMQLLPPEARLDELQPPLAPDELFTLKVNAKVASHPIRVHLVDVAGYNYAHFMETGATVGDLAQKLRRERFGTGGPYQVFRRFGDAFVPLLETSLLDGEEDRPYLIGEPGVEKYFKDGQRFCPVQCGSTLELSPPSYAEVPKIEVHSGPAHLVIGNGTRTLCLEPAGPGTVVIPDREWRPPASCPPSEICPNCFKALTVNDADLDPPLTGHQLVKALTALGFRPAKGRAPKFLTNGALVLEMPEDLDADVSDSFMESLWERLGSPHRVEFVLNLLRARQHFLRPTNAEEAHGYLWPRGAPKTCPPSEELDLHEYVDEWGGPFTIAFTREQAASALPYFPASVSTPPAPKTFAIPLDSDDDATVLMSLLAGARVPFQLQVVRATQGLRVVIETAAAVDKDLDLPQLLQRLDAEGWAMPAIPPKTER